MPFLGSALTTVIESDLPRPRKVSRSETHLDARKRLLSEIGVWLDHLDALDSDLIKEQRKLLAATDVETLLGFVGVNLARLRMLDGDAFAEKVEDRVEKRVNRLSRRLYGYHNPYLIQEFKSGQAATLRHEQR